MTKHKLLAKAEAYLAEKINGINSRDKYKLALLRQQYKKRFLSGNTRGMSKELTEYVEIIDLHMHYTRTKFKLDEQLSEQLLWRTYRILAS